MANNEPKYKHPDQEAIEKYLKDIAFWKQKEQEAIEKKTIPIVIGREVSYTSNEPT